AGFRMRPTVFCVLFGLSLLANLAPLFAFVLIALNLHIGDLNSLDYLVAAPLSMVANMLPFTPGGLGIGEAAFDHLCQWLDPMPGAAPYARIFFAVRAVSMITLLVRLVSFVFHRSDVRPTREG